MPRRARTAAKSQHSSARKRIRPLLGTERYNGFVGDCIRCVAQRCPDVVFLQSRICIQEIRGGHTLGELAQQQLHRQAGTPNHRLTLHDGRIDLDAVGHGSTQTPLYQRRNQAFESLRRKSSTTEDESLNRDSEQTVDQESQPRSTGWIIPVMRLPNDKPPRIASVNGLAIWPRVRSSDWDLWRNLPPG